MTALLIWIAAWILLGAGASGVVIGLMRLMRRRHQRRLLENWQAEADRRVLARKGLMSDWLRNRGRNGFDRGGGGAP